MVSETAVLEHHTSKVAAINVCRQFFMGFTWALREDHFQALDMPALIRCIQFCHHTYPRV
jgi:hypothetical protein